MNVSLSNMSISYGLTNDLMVNFEKKNNIDETNVRALMYYSLLNSGIEKDDNVDFSVNFDKDNDFDDSNYENFIVEIISKYPQLKNNIHCILYNGIFNEDNIKKLNAE